MTLKTSDKLYWSFEENFPKLSDQEIQIYLDKFTEFDYEKLPIIFDLIVAKKVNMLQALLKRNISFKYTEYGSNALHTASAISGSLECVKFLIENNICNNIYKQNDRGETPYSLAKQYEHEDILKYFKETNLIQKKNLSKF